jgi:sugar O-acyltransferase (sialic acid O-acetyltransferase NeuD family)
MKLIVVGAGGHASVVIDVAHLTGGSFEIVGLVDDAVPVGSRVSGFNVLGTIAEIGRFPHDAVAFAVGDNIARARLFDRLQAAGEHFPTFVHPSATVAASASLGPGTVVLAHAVVAPEAVIEADVIVNTGATIDHHSVVGAHAHIAPGVHIAGGCRVGEGAAIGIGSVIAPDITVGARTMVGAGSVIISDIPADKIAFGTPARVIRDRRPGDSFD